MVKKKKKRKHKQKKTKKIKRVRTEKGFIEVDASKSGRYPAKLTVSKLAYRKIKILNELAQSDEWMGLLKTKLGKEKGEIIVTDVYIPPQTASGGGVRLLEEPMLDEMSKMIEKNPKALVDFAGVIHSHAGMACFWSGTDDEWHKNLRGYMPNNKVFVSIVVNNSMECRSMFIFRMNEIDIHLDNVDTFYNFDEDKLFDQVKTEYDAKVKQPQQNQWTGWRDWGKNKEVKIDPKYQILTLYQFERVLKANDDCITKKDMKRELRKIKKLRNTTSIKKRSMCLLLKLLYLGTLDEHDAKQYFLSDRVLKKIRADMVKADQALAQHFPSHSRGPSTQQLLDMTHETEWYPQYNDREKDVTAEERDAILGHYYGGHISKQEMAFLLYGNGDIESSIDEWTMGGRYVGRYEY